jgi:hypothetical protein
MKTTKQGNIEIYFLGAAVDKDSYADDNTAKFIYRVNCPFNRATRSQDIIDYEDTFTSLELKIPAEDSRLSLFLSKDASYSQLPAYLKSEDNTPGGWTGNHIHRLALKMLNNKTAKFLSMNWIL